MIDSITIHNILLIDHVELSFSDGFIGITGETGSGKSIFLQSLQVGLGYPASQSLIRVGCESGWVELEIDISKSINLQKWCHEEDIEIDQNILILRRTLNKGGKSKSRINGVTVSSSILQKISEYIVDFHQHQEHVLLFDENYQLSLVDQISKNQSLLQEYQQIFQQYVSNQNELNILLEKKEDADLLIESIERKINDFDIANLELSEEELQQESFQLSAQQEISNRIVELDQILHVENGFMDQLGSIQRVLKYVKESHFLGMDQNEIHENISFWNYFSKEVQTQLFEHSDRPNQLERIDTMLLARKKLSQKYSLSSEELLSKYQQLKEELTQLKNIDLVLEQIQKNMELAENKALKIATQLSVKRFKSAKNTEKKVNLLLKNIGMKDADFKIQITDKSLSIHGMERVDFLISTNLGQPLKPLKEMVSSGELGRIMLILKTVLSEVDNRQILVFDEIDANVGGETAHLLADHLLELSKNHQVFIVTHLAQIASRTNQHLGVFKKVIQNQTYTLIENLDSAGRINEIERMLGGKKYKNARFHAEELLNFNTK